MADIIQVRRDTAANWTIADTLLANGEIGYEIDTAKIKIGDGVTAWTSLAYNLRGATELDGLTDVTLTSPATGEALMFAGSPAIAVNRLLLESDVSDLGVYANKDLTPNTKTASYTLILTDADTKIIEMNLTATANNLTVPPNSSVAFLIGTRIDIVQYGTGVTTVVQGAGVTIRTAETLVLDGQYAGATLYKRATDEWVLIGRLVAA